MDFDPEIHQIKIMDVDVGAASKHNFRVMQASLSWI